ncbi:hypothetical protein [Methanoregula sp.]|uniref:hypothetical protein n=1 Tax=Methanoregula sp. TaxID=2052170 RepID=UPI000CB009C8|nr:hypothetical protein [Methanoregula sp.]PKG31716.1 MAG: hypothetical protein CW742_11940 [Methanoregula sp.]
MADYVQKTNIKSASRKLSEPIADVDAFNTIVQSIITGNPFGCISYMSGGTNHPPVEKSKENYTAKFVYQNNDAKSVGTGSESYNSIAGFKAGLAAIIADTANITAHGGIPVHASQNDTFSATLKCYDPNGEMYFVNLTRTQVTISSYEDDAIRTKIETWSDGVAALA